MVLIQPIKPVSQLKLEAATAKKPTLLSLVRRKPSESNGDPQMVALNAIRSRLKQQREKSTNEETCPHLSSNHPLSPPPQDACAECVFEHKEENEDGFFEEAMEKENQNLEEKDLIQM